MIRDLFCIVMGAIGGAIATLAFHPYILHYANLVGSFLFGLK